LAWLILFFSKYSSKVIFSCITVLTRWQQLWFMYVDDTQRVTGYATDTRV
jgi:hypothetical protein